MNEKKTLLIAVMDGLGNMQEAEAIQNAVLWFPKKIKISIMYFKSRGTLRSAAKNIIPDWIHIIARSDRDSLFFSSHGKIISAMDRTYMVSLLLRNDPLLELITMNSVLDDRDIGSLGQIIAIVGMKNGWNPLASRVFFPRFYREICEGIALGPAFEKALEALQFDVIKHGGEPSMCYAYSIDPQKYSFISNRTNIVKPLIQ